MPRALSHLLVQYLYLCAAAMGVGGRNFHEEKLPPLAIFPPQYSPKRLESLASSISGIHVPLFPLTPEQNTPITLGQFLQLFPVGGTSYSDTSTQAPNDDSEVLLTVLSELQTIYEEFLRVHSEKRSLQAFSARIKKPIQQLRQAIKRDAIAPDDRVILGFIQALLENKTALLDTLPESVIQAVIQKDAYHFFSDSKAYWSLTSRLLQHPAGWKYFELLTRHANHPELEISRHIIKSGLKSIEFLETNPQGLDIAINHFLTETIDTAQDLIDMINLLAWIEHRGKQHVEIKKMFSAVVKEAFLNVNSPEKFQLLYFFDVFYSISARFMQEADKLSDTQKNYYQNLNSDDYEFYRFLINGVYFVAPGIWFIGEKMGITLRQITRARHPTIAPEAPAAPKRVRLRDRDRDRERDSPSATPPAPDVASTPDPASEPALEPSTDPMHTSDTTVTSDATALRVKEKNKRHKESIVRLGNTEFLRMQYPSKSTSEAPPKGYIADLIKQVSRADAERNRLATQRPDTKKPIISSGKAPAQPLLRRENHIRNADEILTEISVLFINFYNIHETFYKESDANKRELLFTALKMNIVVLNEKIKELKVLTPALADDLINTKTIALLRNVIVHCDMQNESRTLEDAFDYFASQLFIKQYIRTPLFEKREGEIIFLYDEKINYPINQKEYEMFLSVVHVSKTDFHNWDITHFTRLLSLLDNLIKNTADYENDQLITIHLSYCIGIIGEFTRNATAHTIKTNSALFGKLEDLKRFRHKVMHGDSLNSTEQKDAISLIQKIHEILRQSLQSMQEEKTTPAPPAAAIKFCRPGPSHRP